MKGVLYPYLFLFLLFGISSLKADPWIITGETVVISQPMTWTGDIIVYTDGVLRIQADMSLTGSIYVVENGVLTISGCAFRLLSTFNGQFGIYCVGMGVVTIQGAQFSTNGMQAGIIAAEHGSVAISNSSFLLDPAGVIQPSVYDDGSMTVERSLGQFESIIRDRGSFVARDIPPYPYDPSLGLLWVWPFFTEGNEATLHYPAQGILDFSFPSPGDVADFSYTLERVNVPFWPLLISDDTVIHLVDNPPDRHLIIGLVLPNDTSISLQNGTAYTDTTLPLTDRDVTLTDTTVTTWNLYPWGEAHVRVHDSLLGEILSMGNSRAYVTGSIIDGSGGFLGAKENSTMTLYDTTVTTVVESTGSAHLDLIDCSLEPHPAGIPSSLTLAEEGEVWMHNTDLPTNLVNTSADCLIRTDGGSDPGGVTLDFSSSCFSGSDEPFTGVAVIVTQTRTNETWVLYEGEEFNGGTLSLPLPSECTGTCNCRMDTAFTYAGKAYHYGEVLCEDPSGHRRPFDH